VSGLRLATPDDIDALDRAVSAFGVHLVVGVRGVRGVRGDSEFY
jgi:hypothetical protein